MINKIGLDKSFILLLIILSLLLFMGIFNNSITYITFIVNIIILFKGNVKYIFGQLFFLLPFAMIYKNSPTDSSFFTYLMIFSAFYFLLIKKINVLLLFPIAFYILIGGLGEFSTWLKIIMGFILLLSFVKIADFNIIKIVIVSFAMGLIISSIIACFKQDIPQLSVFFSDFNEEYIGGVKVSRFSGLYQDPNFYSISIVMSVYLIINLVIRKLLPLAIGIVLMIVLIYFGSLSYSKMFILCMSLVFLTQLSTFILKSRFKFLGILLGVILFVYVSYLFFNSEYFNAFSTRLDTDDLSNNRFLIWGFYINYMMENVLTLILGAGLSAPLVNGAETHNTYIESLYLLGILGSLLYVCTINVIFRAKKLVNKVSNKDRMLLVIFAIMISTLHTLLVHDFMFYIILIWVSLNISYYENTSITH